MVIRYPRKWVRAQFIIFGGRLNFQKQHRTETTRRDYNNNSFNRFFFNDYYNNIM